MRAILAVRRDEFVIAALTALAVIMLGVEQGIVLAVVASIIDHLRTGYAPHNTVLVPTDDDRFTSVPFRPDARTREGLVTYRFAATLYYANAHRLVDQVSAIVTAQAGLRVFCLDLVAVGDVDFTAAAALRRVHHQVTTAGARMRFSNTSARVRRELDRYGITELVGGDAYLDTPRQVLDTFPAQSQPGTANETSGPGLNPLPGRVKI
jgi:MFS superfamily sulfate permease-like transporter